MWSKLKGWKERLLTQAGKEVLIKAMVQAIPAFTLSCFQLPDYFCKELETLTRKFWWGSNGDHRKMAWIKWDTMCLPKAMGGMGFRDLKKFNEALLSKQVWRLWQNKSSLFYKVFKSKFFPRGTILDASESRQGSFLSSKHVIHKGARWRIGNGQMVRIWKDSWLPKPIIDD